MNARINQRQLTVWIINPYGTIPGEGYRDYRSTLIAKALAEAGHKIVWWVSNFNHRPKTFRSPTWKDIDVNPNFTIRIVPSTAYASHISFQRINYERTFARCLCERAATSEPPDIIILAEPALFISSFVLKLIEHWKTKLIVDVIDLWPELFHITLPVLLSKLGRLIFLPFYMRRAKLFRRADAIVAVSADYLNIAKKIASEKISDVIYFGVDVQGIQTMLASDIPSEVLRQRTKAHGDVWAIYVGTLGDNYDIRTILLAAELLAAKNCPVTILVAGEGPLKNEVISTVMRKSLKNIVVVETLGAEAVTRLYGVCEIALSTYLAGSTVSMPLKAYDYLAAGLPVVNSLDREFGSIVREKNIGLQYTPQDPISLSNAIQQLVENPALRAKMSDNARRLAPSFDEAVQHRKFVDIIDQVIDSSQIGNSVKLLQ